MHRWVWDLHYPAPVSATRGYPISGVPHATPRQPQGPLAIPGDYRVRLTFDGKRLEAPLTLKPDPRVTASAEALAQQLRLASRLSDLLTQSSQTFLTAQSEEAQLKSLAPGAAVADAAQAYQARLALLTGAAEPAAGQAKPPPPAAGAGTTAQPAAPQSNLKEVQEQIAGLYAELMRGDAAPTAAQLGATDIVQATLGGLVNEWKKLQADLPDLNKRLRAAQLAPIRTDLPPPRDANLADEE
jgi:hypothetical protein